MNSATITKKTNKQRVLDYVLTHGSITNLESSELKPKILALSQEIDRLEKDGWVFDHKRERGDVTNWVRYRLVSTPQNAGTVMATKRIDHPGREAGQRWRIYECHKGHHFPYYGDGGEKQRCEGCNWQEFGYIQ